MASNPFFESELFNELNDALKHSSRFTATYRIVAGDYADAAGSDVVIITAGAQIKVGQDRQELAQINSGICVEIARELEHYAPDAILIIVTNPCDVLAHFIVSNTGYPPDRVISAGCVIDTARLMKILGDRVGLDPKNVFGMVMGEHGMSATIPWSIANIAGLSIDDYCVAHGMPPFDKAALLEDVKQAGIEAVPTSYDDLIAAGKAFQEKLGDDYYPLAIGQYDRMILMTFYLESKYGKAWVENNECQYSEEEVVDGLNFIKSLEDNHVIPTRPTMIAAGFDSIDKSQEWIDGKYAGIFEWDSAPSKYQSALADNSGFTVGEEIKFGDKANGGFSKVSMGMAITKSCQHPVEAAALIDFLWNGEGAAIMGSECGIPASKAGLATAQAAGKINELVAEANGKVMSFVSCQLDPLFESSDLKATGTGTYQEVFDTVDYDNKSGADVVDVLLDGMSAVGYTV